MKILMLNPSYGKNFVRSARWAARSRGRVQRHPDYLSIATAVLESAGHKVKLLDAAALNIDFDGTKEMSRTFKPDLSVIHTTTPSIYNDIKHAEMLQDLGSTTVLIGQHASALPMETMQMSEKIDYIARGEYDYTLRDIANCKDPSNIFGITYRNGNEIINHEDRPLIKNLDELPFPAWHQIDVHDYFDASKLYPFITMISGRGCPNNCSFCVLPQVFYGKRYRFRSAKKVVDEIEYDLSLFPDLKEIMFEDDTLTADKKRCEDICHEIIDRGSNRKISWSANARADLDDFGLLKLMKESGCRMLVVGYEFGDQKILDNVRKRLTIEQMKEFAKLARKAGIMVHGCFMIGGPGETKETIKMTKKLIRDVKPDILQVLVASPIPGTKFYDWVKENGYLLVNDLENSLDEEGFQKCIISYPDFTKEDIESYVDRALKEYYLSTSYILIAMRNVLRKNGLHELKGMMTSAKVLLKYLKREKTREY